jgi:hypothetical protein
MKETIDDALEAENEIVGAHDDFSFYDRFVRLTSKVQPIVAAVRDFVEQEVRPMACAIEHADSSPRALVTRLKELGLCLM